MTKYAGRSLEALIAEGRLSRLGYKDRLKIMRQLVDAVDAMNARGVSHNDLKIDNICVSDTGSGYEVCVIDMGLATTDGLRMVFQGEWEPWCSWFAPEMYINCIEAVSGAVDVWAMGQFVAQILDEDNLDPEICMWIEGSQNLNQKTRPSL